jgi:two-component sensor histidine kinase
MVLNELCTNAVKYGALSRSSGRVSIDATVPANTTFLLVWSEIGGPTVSEPTRRSFGSKLIEQALVAQLNGKARLGFEPGGVRYELEVPLAAFE